MLNNQILAWLGSLIAGIGIISVIVKKYSGKVKRFIRIAREALDLVDELIKSAEDQKITTEEIERIKKETQELTDALNEK